MSTSDSKPLCATCNGSGEGMHDGTLCSLCKGSGLEEAYEDQGDRADYEYEMWKERSLYTSKDSLVTGDVL